jgi:hypothetical protein
MKSILKPHRLVLPIITVITILILPVLSGCIDFSDTLSFFDKELRRAEPYIEKVLFNDDEVLMYALEICQNCTFTDNEQIITTVYRHIVEEYSYISDPEDNELIRGPLQTKNLKGGDCEDLSILLMSLLENLGIKTYLVLTENHAYALAYDVDIDNLWGYVEQSLIKQVEKDSGENLKQHYKDTFVLKRHQFWYYGGEGDPLNQSKSFDYLNITYTISSSRPMNMYVVPSKDEFDHMTNDEDFTYYQDHMYENSREIEGICALMTTHGGVILSNPNWYNCDVSVDLLFYSHPSFYKLFENNTIESYLIEETFCVVLEPTAGPYGYPGYDANVTGKKTAIDPITKEYFFLD